MFTWMWSGTYVGQVKQVHSVTKFGKHVANTQYLTYASAFILTTWWLYNAHMFLLLSDSVMKFGTHAQGNESS